MQLGFKVNLESEAHARKEKLVSRFKNERCISCGTAGVAPLTPVDFHWRKQVGRETNLRRVEHTSRHELCEQCLAQLQTRRKVFWPLRYAAGIGLAGGLCGVIGVTCVLYIMRLRPDEQRQAIWIGIAAALLLPVSIFGLWMSRRLSVPQSLVDMTRDGWECVAVAKQNCSSTAIPVSRDDSQEI